MPAIGYTISGSVSIANMRVLNAKAARAADAVLEADVFATVFCV
jgi:hypothetical protein